MSSSKRDSVFEWGHSLPNFNYTISAPAPDCQLKIILLSDFSIIIRVFFTPFLCLMKAIFRHEKNAAKRRFLARACGNRTHLGSSSLPATVLKTAGHTSTHLLPNIDLYYHIFAGKARPVYSAGKPRFSLRKSPSFLVMPVLSKYSSAASAYLREVESASRSSARVMVSFAAKWALAAAHTFS